VGVPDPQHLLDQARQLIIPPLGQRSREESLRRGISTAYYAVFHHVLAAAADQFVGEAQRGSPRYALVYRSVSHRALRQLCQELRKPTVSSKYQAFVPSVGFGKALPAFATAYLELYEKRHSADYDPAFSVKRLDAIQALATAREGIERFGRSTPVRRRMFLTLLGISAAWRRWRLRGWSRRAVCLKGHSGTPIRLLSA
jgi:hypothetical protein